MITEESDWVPLTTAATRLGCTVKDIHELVKESAIPVEHEPLNAQSSMILVRLKDIRAYRAHKAHIKQGDRLASWVYDHPAVWTNPHRLGGVPCVWGTRVPVEYVLAMIQDGQDPEEIRDAYPSVSLASVWDLEEALEKNGNPMATNRERAARALYDHRLSVGDFPDGVTEWEDLPDPWKDEWREAADFLGDRGLLADDLPAPDIEEGVAWWEVRSDELPGAYNAVYVDEEGIWDKGELITPSTARKRAQVLRAAAAHAQKDNNHE